MAKTASQLEQEFEAISDLTREAYDAIYGAGSGRGFKGAGSTLDQKYKLAVQDYQKNPDKINQEKLNAIKPEWERRQKEYKRVQTQKNLLRKQFNQAKKDETVAKETQAKNKLAISGYNNALDKLSNAELELDTYNGQEKYIAAYQEAKVAYDDAVAAGANPKALPPQKITVPDIQKKDAEGKTKQEQQAPEISLAEFYDVLADPKNKQQLIDVQNDLIRNFGWKGKADGQWSLSFQQAVGSAASTRDQLPESLRGKDFRSFLSSPGISGLTGGAGGLPQGSVELSTLTEAADTVESVFQSELGRLPTKKELKEYTKLLQAEEKKFSSVVRPVKQVINGVEVTQYAGGLNRSQFLQGLVRELPEYKQSKKAARDNSLNELQATALANGLDLNKNFGPDVAQSWAKRIQNGEDIDIFKGMIREAAAVGLPENMQKLVKSGTNLDTIFSPYRRTMASILEVPENSITLDDPLLRSAIGPDKNMTIYEFQRQLRKDPRWQYTDNAREEVSSAALNILRDFGFQG